MVAGKPKIVDEVWDDARIKQFLHYDPCSGDPDPAFCLISRAYKYMRPDDFERFVRFFTDAGHDLNARDDTGRTLMDVISTHRHAAPFLAVLNQAQN